MEITSTIVKRILLPAMIIYILMGGHSYAAEAPSAAEQSGYIMDNNQMFTKNDIQRMNKALSGQPYDLYVMTASGLDEAAGIRLVNEAYDEGKFDNTQLLLLITKSPNYVHLVFENEQLSERIASSNSGDVQGIINTQFIPYAKNGDLAGGVIAVSHYVNGLRDLSTSVPSSEQQANGAANQKLMNSILYSVGAVIVLLAIIVLVIRPVMQTKRRQKRSVAKQNMLQSQQHHASEQEQVDDDEHVEWTVHPKITVPLTMETEDRMVGNTQAMSDSKQHRQPSWLSPEDIERIRLELLDVIQKEKLIVPDLDDPFGLLHQAKQSAEQLNQQYSAGKKTVLPPDAVEILESIHQDIYEARERIVQLLFFRNEALQAAEEAKQQLDGFHLLSELYERESQHVQQTYADAHLHEQQQWYAEIKQYIAQLEELLPELLDTLDSEKQQYRQAGEYTVLIHDAIEQITLLARKIKRHVDELDLRKKQAMEQWELLSSQHRLTVQQLAEIQADLMLAQQAQNNSFAALELAWQYLMKVPLDLIEAEKKLQRAAGELEVFLLQAGPFVEDQPAAQQHLPAWLK